MNAVQKEHEVELVPEIHIGVAVSLEEGLLVPTIQRADAKHLAQIAANPATWPPKRARGARPMRRSPGTFTITNLGAYGLTRLHRLLTPHRSASWGGPGGREAGGLSGRDHQAVDDVPQPDL